MPRQNTSIVINNPKIIEMLYFLSKPVSFWRVSQHEQPKSINLKGMSNLTSQQLYFFTNASSNEQNELKGLFENISSTVKGLLKDLSNEGLNISRARFNNFYAKIDHQLSGLNKFKATHLVGGHDNPDTAIHQKFFVGQSSLPAFFVETLKTIHQQCKQISETSREK